MKRSVGTGWIGGAGGFYIKIITPFSPATLRKGVDSPDDQDIDSVTMKRISPIGQDRSVEAVVVDYALGANPAEFGALLQEMRSRAGLTIAAVCAKLEIRPGTMYQYFYKKRGVGGSSTMRWFLRYAEACGCEVTVRFPASGRRVRVRV